MIEKIRDGKYGKFAAWLAGQVEKRPKLKKLFSKAATGVNKRPLLKKTLKWGLVGFAVINIANLVAQFAGYGAFAAAWTRKHTTLRDDYALAAACADKLDRGQPCTVAEGRARSRAWNNDVFMCYGYGAGCLGEYFLNRASPPAPKSPAPPIPPPAPAPEIRF